MTVGTLHLFVRKSEEMIDTRYRTEFRLALIPDQVLIHRGFLRGLLHPNIHTNWVLPLQNRNRTTQVGQSKLRRYLAEVYTIHHMKQLVAPSSNHRLQNLTWTILASKIASLSKACSRSKPLRRPRLSPICKRVSSQPGFQPRLPLPRSDLRSPSLRRPQQRWLALRNLHCTDLTKTTIDIRSIRAQLLRGTTIQYQLSTNLRVLNLPEHTTPQTNVRKCHLSLEVC